MGNAIRILIETELNLCITLWNTYILTILILLIHKHELSFHLLVSSLILVISVLSFQCTDLTASWLNLFPSILFFLTLLYMGLFS